MEQSKLNEILELHKKWVNSEDGGVRAILRGANLTGANLRYANLRYAELTGANLTGANLRNADLRNADLTYADLRGANLTYAELRGANLTGADLTGANLDFGVLPLWCGGLNFTIDEKQAKQLMYHFVNLMQYSKIDTSKILKKQVYKWLEDSHVVTIHRLTVLKEELK